MLADFEALEYALYRDALDRSIVARLGVMATLAQEWSGAGATGDRANVESNRPSEYSHGVWDVIVEVAAYRLVRREGFWIMHGSVARGLEREGRLTHEQVAELAAGSPEPTSFRVGAPRSEAAASAGVVRARSMKRSRLADAASGSPVESPSGRASRLSG